MDIKRCPFNVQHLWTCPDLPQQPKADEQCGPGSGWFAVINLLDIDPQHS
jgi:hypothetical protein